LILESVNPPYLQQDSGTGKDDGYQIEEGSSNHEHYWYSDITTNLPMKMRVLVVVAAHSQFRLNRVGVSFVALWWVWWLREKWNTELYAEGFLFWRKLRFEEKQQDRHVTSTSLSSFPLYESRKGEIFRRELLAVSWLVYSC
jgi:hypothetical protein